MPQQRRIIRLDLSDPLFDPIYDLAAKTYPGTPGGVAAVTRELLLVSLGWDPTKAAITAARKRAHYEVTTQARALLSQALADMARQLGAEALVTESALKIMREEEAEFRDQ